MGDCSKGIWELTPYESYRCFVEADFWKIVDRNTQRMWSGFTGTTNGEWIGIIVAFAILPAQFASYILPFYFVYRSVERVSSRQGMRAVGERERQRKNRWGAYLLICGGITIGLSPHDRFMFIQGAWEIFCGAMIFLLGPSWWVSKQKSTALAE
jgi:hypothetical protein